MLSRKKKTKCLINYKIGNTFARNHSIRSGFNRALTSNKLTNYILDYGHFNFTFDFTVKIVASITLFIIFLTESLVPLQRHRGFMFRRRMLTPDVSHGIMRAKHESNHPFWIFYNWRSVISNAKNPWVTIFK